MTEFIIRLIQITGVSNEYAVAVWYSLNDEKRKTPIKSADRYKQRFNL